MRSLICDKGMIECALQHKNLKVQETNIAYKQQVETQRIGFSPQLQSHQKNSILYLRSTLKQTLADCEPILRTQLKDTDIPGIFTTLPLLRYHGTASFDGQYLHCLTPKNHVKWHTFIGKQTRNEAFNKDEEQKILQCRVLFNY